MHQHTPMYQSPTSATRTPAPGACAPLPLPPPLHDLFGAAALPPFRGVEAPLVRLRRPPLSAHDVLTPNTENSNFPCQVPNFRKCEICLLSFPKETQFQRHMRDHEQNDKPHRCDQCPMSFNVEFNLTLHKCTHNGEDPTCPVCNKKFSRVASLKAHIMLHEKEENLICSECGDEFTLQSQLSIHMEEHRQELAGSRIHSCKSCKKEFETSSQLKEHMKTHYKIRVSNTRSYNRNIDRSGFTYSCPHCGKTFQKPSQLTRHVRIHTGERPFKCSECGKAFNQKGALQTHMIKHTGEKPHACAFCPAAFSQKGNLQSHIQRVHSEVKNGPTYNCTECSCVFKSLGSLNTHISKMHMGGPQNSASASTDVSHVTADSVTQSLATSSANLLQPVDNKWKNATHFRSPLLQQPENQVSSAAAHQGQQAVTDVIQQLLELSEPGPVENNQPQQPGQQLNIAVGINRDILQQALENSGLSSIPVSAHSTDCSQTKTPGTQDQNPDVQTLSNHQADSNNVEQDKEQESADKLDKKEKKFIKKKSSFLPGVRPFACPHCDKKFRTSGHRKTHIASHFKHTELRKLRHQRKPAKVRVGKMNAPVPDIPLQEPILITDLGLIQPIPRSSQFFQNYFNNNFVNDGDRPYKCFYCQRAYKKSCHLKQHIRSHTGEKPFKCSQCGRGFVSAGVLKAHIRTHTGLKAFKCLICNGAFTTGGSLRRHMGIHNDLRPYMCPYCQKTFKTSLNCKKHMKTHRYELAQQLQQHEQSASIDDSTVDQQSIHVSTQMQVEIESDELQQSEAVATDQQAILELDQQPVVGTEETALEQQLTDQPLEQDEDRFVTSQHALQENITQFEQQAVTQQPFDQQGLSQGFTVNDSYNQQTQFPAVQQLQDSSTLESQALSTSYHPPALLQVPNTDTINVTTRLIQDQASQEELELHTQRPHFLEDNEDQSKRSYRCEYCNKGFKKSSHLKQHVRSHTGEKPYKCQLCGRGFVSSGVLKSHEKTHTGVKAFSCSICNTSFTTNGSLTRHMATHMSMKPYKCPFCDESFRTTVHCKKHMKKHQAVSSAVAAATETGGGVVACEDDDENSERTSRKSRPGVITFTEEETAELAKIRPRETATVSEKVLVQSAAEKDRISEIKDKQAELEAEPKYANCCSYCPKSFKKPSDLVRHVRIHTGEKPYKCEECGKSFTVKSTLDCHVKTHTGQKLFSCHVCSNSFSTKGSLKVHMRLHTGAKPFKCPHCDLRFRTSGRRKTHIQCHYKPEAKKVRKPVARTSAEGLQPVNLLNSSSTDPNVFIMNNSVLTNQFDQNLLQQGLVGQAILPASVSAGGDLTVSLTDGSLATLEGIQLQLAANLVGQNVQISGIDATSINNITLQIDPSILQQTLQQSNLLAQQLTGDPSMTSQNSSLPATENAVPANVVIQPLSGLSLQPTVTSSANMTIGSLSEQESVLTTSASGTQDISQVMTSQGMVSSSNGQHEIMLTINNSSLSQVLAHASGSTTTSSSGSPQEITLTISGQDLIQHNSGSSDLNSSLRLTAPTINSQTTGATLTISNDQLLSQGTSLNTPELNTTGGTNLPSTTPISQSTVSTQNLVMSSSGVGGDGSVTLTLADTQGMLSGGLDAVTLNITSQGQQFPAILTDSSLASQSGSGSQQVILVSHTSHSASANSDEITYQVTEVSPNVTKSSQTEKEGRVHQCFECSQTFSSATMLMQHSKEVHGKERIHVCHVCNKAFKRATHLKEHMQTHQAGPSLSSQKPRVFKCDTCEKAFAKPSQLERHSRIHTGERPFQCTLCEKAFNQKSALQVHMKKHTGERPYKCDYCAMGFTQKSNMKLHMKRAHGYTGPVQEPASHPEQEGEDISRALNLEEVVPESSNEWQSIGNVFR
ncbi:zinc finger protein 236 isoform 12-T13 [Amazona ochrocephala]